MSERPAPCLVFGNCCQRAPERWNRNPSPLRLELCDDPARAAVLAAVGLCLVDRCTAADVSRRKSLLLVGLTAARWRAPLLQLPAASAEAALPCSLPRPSRPPFRRAPRPARGMDRTCFVGASRLRPCRGPPRAPRSALTGRGGVRARQSLSRLARRGTATARPALERGLTAGGRVARRVVRGIKSSGVGRAGTR